MMISEKWKNLNSSDYVFISYLLFIYGEWLLHLWQIPLKLIFRSRNVSQFSKNSQITQCRWKIWQKAGWCYVKVQSSGKMALQRYKFDLNFPVLPYGPQLALFNLLWLQMYCDEPRHMEPFCSKGRRERSRCLKHLGRERHCSWNTGQQGVPYPKLLWGGLTPLKEEKQPPPKNWKVYLQERLAAVLRN